VGKRPWREIEPITPLTSAGPRWRTRSGRSSPRPGGQTGLYDTALAAYRTCRTAGRRPGQLGAAVHRRQDENPDGISRATLVAELKKLADPKRPVRHGHHRHRQRGRPAELEAIAKATSAAASSSRPDPAKIADIFLEAISSRSGAAS
jgi:hypothetical protein